MDEEEFNFEAAAALPDCINFGASSWTYPGWKDVVYHQGYVSEKDFRSRSLGEYSEFPWFRTVGIDSFFYAAPNSKTLEQYVEFVPEAFRWVSKVWEDITVPVFGRHPRYGARAGQRNPNFLHRELFCDKVLAPLSEGKIKKHNGPLVFQFQRFPFKEAQNPNWFFDKLHKFLSDLPKDFQYAIEIRNPELLFPDYFTLLNESGSTHCFNHWTGMPPLIEQMKAAAQGGGLIAPFYVSRLLTPLGTSYKEAVDRFAPYDKIKEPNQQMRDDVVRLARRAFQRKATAYIIVNNRSEGHSPKTINDIGSMIVDQVSNWENEIEDGKSK